MTAEKALIFEPSSPATLKLLTLTLPRLRIPSTNIDGFPATSTRRLTGSNGNGGSSSRESVHGVSHAEYMATYYGQLDGNGDTQQPRSLPFELEILEGALAVAVGECAAVFNVRSVAWRSQAVIGVHSRRRLLIDFDLSQTFWIVLGLFWTILDHGKCHVVPLSTNQARGYWTL